MEMLDCETRKDRVSSVSNPASEHIEAYVYSQFRLLAELEDAMPEVCCVLIGDIVDRNTHSFLLTNAGAEIS